MTGDTTTPFFLTSLEFTLYEDSADPLGRLTEIHMDHATHAQACCNPLSALISTNHYPFHSRTDIFRAWHQPSFDLRTYTDTTEESGRSCCALALPCDELTLSFCKAPGLGPSAEPHSRTLRTYQVLAVQARALTACWSFGFFRHV